MGFIVGRAYPIIQSMAKKGNKKAQALIDRLDSMSQDEVDSEVSALMSGDGKPKQNKGSTDGKPQLKGKEKKTLSKKGLGPMGKELTKRIEGKMNEGQEFDKAFESVGKEASEKLTKTKTVVPILPRGGLSDEQMADLEEDNTPKSFTDVVTGQGEAEGSPKQKLARFVDNKKQVYDDFNIKAAEMEQSQPGLANFPGIETALKEAEEQYSRLGVKGVSMTEVPAEMIRNNRGVTVKNNQMIEPTKGYQVSFDKDSEIRLDMTGDGLKQVDEALALVKEKGIIDYGIWFDGENNQVVLDPSSTWIGDRLTMAQLATIGDQDSIVNWEESALSEEMVFEGREQYMKTFEAGQDEGGFEGKFKETAESMKFDPSTISFEQIEEVSKKLGLNGKDRAQLQNIRDGVVRDYEKLVYEYDESGEPVDRNMEAYDKYYDAMSAITAAIDYKINRANGRGTEQDDGEPFESMKTNKEYGPKVSEGEKANRQVMGQMGIDNPEQVAGSVSESQEPKKAKGKLYERITSQLDGDFGPEHFYDLEDDTIGITPIPGDAKYDATLWTTSDGQFALALFKDGEELNTDELDYFDSAEEAAQYALDTDNYDALQRDTESDVPMDEEEQSDNTNVESEKNLQSLYDRAKAAGNKEAQKLAEDYAKVMGIKLKK